MATCLGPQSHGGDAGGDPPERPMKRIPSQCEGSGKRGVTKHQNLKKAYKINGAPLELEFEWKDQETFKALSPHGSYFISYIGELIRKLPHNYDSWEKLPEADKASIIPSLEGYFDLRPHLNDETIIKVNGKEKTKGSMVHAGLKKDFQDRYSDNKCKFKRKHFTMKETVQDARDNVPSGWQHGIDEWQKLIDYWLEPERVAKSAKNAQNRSNNKTPTYQGSKSFAQGRHEFFKKYKRYEDLVDHWRRTHTDRNGRFHSAESEDLYARMKAIQEDVKAKKIPFKKDKDIVREVIQSTNRGHESGVGRLLPGTSSGSSCSQASGYCTQEEADRLRKENEELGKAVLSQQLEIQRIVNHLNARQTGTSSQYPVPNLYTPQGFSSPNYTTSPNFEHGGTSHCDADLDVDGDGDYSGSLEGDGGGTLDGDSRDDSNDDSDDEDSNDACGED